MGAETRNKDCVKLYLTKADQSDMELKKPFALRKTDGKGLNKLCFLAKMPTMLPCKMMIHLF